MICTNCGRENPNYAVVCEQCGAFLPKEDPLAIKKRKSILDPMGEKKIRCSYCWSENKAGDSVCSLCGMPLMYVPYPEREGDYSEVPERPEEPEEIEPEEEEFVPVVPELENVSAPPVPAGMVRCRNCWKDSPKTATTCAFCGLQLKRSDVSSYDELKRLRNRTNYLPPGGEPGGQPYGLITETVLAIINSRRMDEKERLLTIREEQNMIAQSQERGANTYSSYKRNVCRSCWYDNPFDVEVCQWCGAALSKPRKVMKGRPGRIPGCTCGYVNQPHLTICVNCGGLLKKACPECGHENFPYVTICGKCGLRLAAPNKDINKR